MKADERTRTVNLLITNQLLCQLSHIGVFCFYMLHRSIGRAQASLVCSPLIDKVNKPELSQIGIFIFIIYTSYSINGTYRARTCDPLLVRQVLSQLSYGPKIYFFISGAPRGTRTPNLLIRSQTVYPVEL